jgi:hypothetical protein
MTHLESRYAEAMRASVFMVGAVSLLAACSSNSGTSSSDAGSGITFQNNGCTLSFSGSYTFTYTQQSGNCGPIASVTEAINGEPNAQNLSAACPGGTGTDVAEPSDGGCTITGNFSDCQSSSGTTFDLVEAAEWNAADTSATGTFSVNIMGQGACSGTYALSVTQP